MCYLNLSILLCLALSAVTTIAGTSTGITSHRGHPPLAHPAPTPDKPPYSTYKGIAIGTKSDDVRTKLGTPKETSDAQDYFVFSDHEAAQIYYDTAKSVTAISVTYTGKLEGAPSAKAIFGEDVPAGADGGVTKMIRYPKAGYWISYIKTGGEDPLIMVAMQKM